jgi:vacuolar protein-sorting-associated protein 4
MSNIFFDMLMLSMSTYNRATANEADVAYFAASGADLTSKWVGGSEKLVRSLFATAVDMSPSIIFLDEIDSIGSSRSIEKSTADQRLTNQLLIEIDAIANNTAIVFVIGATNLPWAIDNALLRRMTRRIFLSLPDEDARKSMFVKGICDVMDIPDNELLEIIKQSDGLSGSDIATILNDVHLEPLRILHKATNFHVGQEVDEESNTIFLVTPFETDDPSACTQGYIISDTNLEQMVDKFTEKCIKIPRIPYTYLKKKIEDSVRTVNTEFLKQYHDWQNK